MNTIKREGSGRGESPTKKKESKSDVDGEIKMYPYLVLMCISFLIVVGQDQLLLGN